MTSNTPQILNNCRILEMPSAIGVSHLRRSLLHAMVLRDWGTDVRFAFTSKDDLLRQSGFGISTVSDITVTNFSSNVFDAYTPADVEKHIDEELKIISAFQPDAVVGDMRLTAAVSSRIAGIPFISVVNGYMTDYFNPVDVLKPKERGRASYTIASFLGRHIQAAQKRKLAYPFRIVAEKHGLRDLMSLYDFLKGDLTLIADLPEFCPLNGLPPSYHYIGPLIWEGTDPTIPEYLEARDQSRPLIYATVGNTGNPLLLQRVVETFRNDPDFDVVLTTGEYLEPAQIPRAGNIRVERFIPGSAVLRLCTAAIHCGGNGTTYQVASQGVPAVVVPFNNDQLINAWLIKRRRLGIPLSSSELDQNRLRLAVKQVVQDSEIKKSLQKYQTLLQNADGPGSAARKIMSFINERQRSQT